MSTFSYILMVTCLFHSLGLVILTWLYMQVSNWLLFNHIVIGCNLPGLDPTIYCTVGVHASDYTTYAWRAYLMWDHITWPFLVSHCEKNIASLCEVIANTNHSPQSLKQIELVIASNYKLLFWCFKVAYLQKNTYNNFECHI